MGDSPTLLYNCVLLSHMGNTASFPLSSRENKIWVWIFTIVSAKIVLGIIKK